MSVLDLYPWENARVALTSSDDVSRDLGQAWAISFLGDVPADIAVIPAGTRAGASSTIAAHADLLVVVGPWLRAHDRLIERFPGTVAYVPADWMPHPGPIVAATRHDRDADGEIRLAGELARREGATLLLAHVWGMPGLGIVEMPPDPYLIGSIPDGQSGALRRLAEQVSARFPELTVQPEVRQGHHVAAELARLAVEASASAIVVGRARTHGGRSPLGPIVHSLLRDAPCAVIIVRPGEPGDLRP